MFSQVQQQTKKVHAILKSSGVDTLSYFHLQENRQYFFSPSGKSFLSFSVFGKVALIPADPVGREKEFPVLLQSFHAYLKTWKLIPCFIGISESFIPLFKKYNFKVTKIGEEAIIDLAKFDINNLKKKVRRAVRYNTSIGVEIFFFTSHNLPQGIRDQMQVVSLQWLREKGRREKGFSMTLKRLPLEEEKDCQFAIAVLQNKVVGYATFVPVYKSKSFSLDNLRKTKSAPNGLSEFILIKSAEYFRKNNVQKLSLNFATFSHVANSPSPMKKIIGKMLTRFYKTNTLKSFNEKLSPSWEGRYCAYSSLKFLPIYIYAILQAERR